MDIKLIELRDRATFIPMLAIRLGPRSEAERYLLGRAGYGLTTQEQQKYIMLMRLDANGPIEWSALDWMNQRTYGTAHRWLIDHWAEIESGGVLDVEFILGETPAPKVSAREQP